MESYNFYVFNTYCRVGFLFVDLQSKRLAKITHLQGKEGREVEMTFIEI